MKKTIFAGLSIILLGVMVGCGQKTVQQPVTNTSTLETKLSTTSESKTTGSTNKSEQVNIISVDEAIKIYQKAHPKTDITSLELENERNGFIYKVEGVDDNKEYDVKIDATSKEIKKDRDENLDKNEQNGVKRKQDKLDLAGILSVDEVTKIAEKETGFGKAVEWNLDKELDTMLWEVSGLDGRKETQVKLDAKSGKVLEFKVDD